MSGWGKAGWLILTIVLPYLGVFVYFLDSGALTQEEFDAIKRKALA